MRCCINPFKILRSWSVLPPWEVLWKAQALPPASSSADSRPRLAEMQQSNPQNTIDLRPIGPPSPQGEHKMLTTTCSHSLHSVQQLSRPRCVPQHSCRSCLTHIRPLIHSACDTRSLSTQHFAASRPAEGLRPSQHGHRTEALSSTSGSSDFTGTIVKHSCIIRPESVALNVPSNTLHCEGSFRCWLLICSVRNNCRDV